MGSLGSVMETCKPYFLLILAHLSVSVLLVLLQSVLSSSPGVSATVLVVYEHLLSAFLLSSLSLFFERGKRPPLSFKILSWTFLLGFLQITSGQLLLTASLRYMTVSFQSVVMNTVPAVVLLLAVVSRREPFRFCGLNGQAKLWGVLSSVAGATVMVVSKDPLTGFPVTGDRFIGFLMVGFAVLAAATSSVLVEWVAMKYPADMTLSAMVNISGTLQTAIIAALTERDGSSWRIRWRGSLQLLTILYGGIVVTGISYYAQIWCIHKNGPVFVSAFSPLLIVFSFLLEMLIVGSTTNLGSIVGTMLVVGGLYLLLWAKSKDYETWKIAKGSQNSSVEGLSREPLLLNRA